MNHETMNRYQTHAQLGAGVIGITWEVEDSRLKGKAILKALYPRLSADPVLRDRILEELERTSELSGMNEDLGLVGVLDHGTHGDSRIFVVTEYMTGEILTSALLRGPLATLEALAIGQGLAQALLTLHQAQLSHGSIHPNNVLLLPQQSAPRTVKLLDAGLSAAYAAMRSAVHPAQRPFLAPEVAAGGASAAADVFALGVLLEQLLPLPRQSAAAAYPRLAGPIAPLRQLLTSMTRAAPAERPTIAQVTALLRHLLGERPGFEEEAPLPVSAVLAVTRLCPATRIHDAQPGLLLTVPDGSALLGALGLPHPAHAAFPALSAVRLEEPGVEGLFLAHPARGLRSLPDAPLPLAQVYRIGYELSMALTSAHERDVYYLGLCKERVLQNAAGALCVLPAPESQRAQAKPPPARSAPGHHHAPEQLRGLSLSEKSDVFALGVLLHQLACGGPPGFPSAGAPALPPDLAELIKLATAEEPSARCAMDWLAEELRFRLRIAELLEQRFLGPLYEGRGRFELQEQLGPAGGCGVVLLAGDRVNNTRVAVKVPHPNFPHSMVEREWDHARRVNGAEHPGIVKTQDLLQGPDGVACIVMEFVPGRTLRSLLTEAGGTLPVPTVVRYGCQIASAMSAVHAPPIAIIHRDLKPENLMIVPDRSGEGDERVRILDFGIATLTAQYQGSQQLRLTRQGIVAGTPTYMAPEQRLGQTVSPAADVYALGIVLLEMLGWPAQTALGPPPRPLPVVAPRPLLRLLANMLAESPQARPTMEQVHRQLSESRERPTLPPWKLALATLGLTAPVLVLGGYSAYQGPEWQVRSDPSGAQVVWLREGEEEPHPLGATPLALRPRSQIKGREAVTLRFQKPGYETLDAEVDPRQALNRAFPLKPLRARLTSVPTAAEVFDAQTHVLLGKTPYRFQAPGSIAVEVRRAGFHPKQVRLAAEPGAAQSVTLDPLLRVITPVPGTAEIHDAVDNRLLSQGPWRCEDGSPRCQVARVRVRAPGYREELRDIPPREDAVLTVSLARITTCSRLTAACLPGLSAALRPLFTAAAGNFSLCEGESIVLNKQGSTYGPSGSSPYPATLRSFLDRLAGRISQTPDIRDRLPITVRLQCPSRSP